MSPRQVTLLKLVLGIILFPQLLLVVAVLWGIAATADETPVRMVFSALASFITLAGLLAGRILFYSPTRTIARLAAFPTFSPEFVREALAHLRRRSTTLLICWFGVATLGVLHLLPLVFERPTLWTLLLTAATAIALPVGAASAGMKAERALLRAARMAEPLALAESLTLLYWLASARPADEVACTIRSRIEADCGTPDPLPNQTGPADATRRI